jgi:3',5'-cyclic AMP phosphodiesterase CpdA
MWVDDEYQAADVELLRRGLAAGGLEVEIVTSKEPSQALLAALSRDAMPSAIIFDWRYENSTVDPREVLSVLLDKAPMLPVILYSAVASPADIQPFPNVRAFVAKDQCDTLVATVGGYLRRDQPRIVHMSDLHFGAGHGHGGTISYDTLLRTLKQEADEVWGLFRPNMLVVSGDLTSAGVRDEFEQATQFLADVARLLGLQRDRVYVVPGNHDVQLSETYAYNNYFDVFIRRFYEDYPAVIAAYLGGRKDSGGRVEQNDLVFVRSTDGIACTVVGLNSVSLTDNPRRRPAGYQQGTYGNLQTGQLTNVAERLRTFGHLDGMRIAVLHHQLFPVPSRRPGTVEGPDEDDDRVVVGQASLLNWLDEHGVQIVLHGHTHYPAARTVTTHYTGRHQQGGHPIHVVAAGTTGAHHVPLAQADHHYGLLHVGQSGRTRRLLGKARVLASDQDAWRDAGMVLDAALESRTGRAREGGRGARPA